MKALAAGLTQPDGQRITFEQADSQLAKKRLLYKFYFGDWDMQTGHPRYSTELTSLLRKSQKNKKVALSEEEKSTKRRRFGGEDEDEDGQIEHDENDDPSVQNNAAQSAWLDDDGIEMLRRLGALL